MARKKKRLVRPAKSARSKKPHAKQKRSRTKANARASRARRITRKTPARKRVTKRPVKRSRKTPVRKPASRKPQRQRVQRLDPQRAEILLQQLTKKIERAKTPAQVRKLQKELGELMRERRALGFRTAHAGNAFEPPEQPTRPRESYDYGDDDDEGDDEEFIGPEGDSYDAAFESIDWDEVDWDDIIDEIGDELEDSYGDEAK